MGEKILLIEDSEAITKNITFNLSRFGYKILSEKTIIAGSIILSKYEIMLIIADIDLLNTENTSIKEQLNIKKDNRFPSIIVLVDEERNILERNHWENITIVTKPFSAAKLLNTVQTILAKEKISQ